MAIIKNKFEILADIEEPVNEISSIISAFITIHQEKRKEILEELRKAIDDALTALKE